MDWAQFAAEAQGLLCANVLGAAKWKPSMWAKLSKLYEFVPAGSPAAASRQVRMAGGVGLGSNSSSSDPPPVYTMRTSADAVSETASRGIHRLLNGVKERIQELLGPTEKIQPELFRASVDLRLPRAFRELAICEGKNFQKAFELHFGTGEPTITDKGIVSWCHIGLWQPWDRTKAYTKAKAVERLAEFYDAGLGISIMEPIVRKLVVASKVMRTRLSRPSPSISWWRQSRWPWRRWRCSS